jgi:AcrR family transcriptional regulator
VPVSAQTRQRSPLTRTHILETALALVDREGADALTMRRLGSELGVAAMSLYNHIAGRDELLDGLAEAMVAQIDTGVVPRQPEDAVRRFTNGIRAVALAHPEAFELVGMRPLHTRAALLPVEAALGALRVMGLPDDDAVHAYRGLVSYARGFALAEIAGFTLEERPETAGTAAPDDLRLETFPHIAELASQLARPDRDAAFAFGLEALLAGLQARLG